MLSSTSLLIPAMVPPVLRLPAALVEDGFSLRAQEEADQPFILHLYAAARWPELSVTGWSDEQKLAFCQSQSALQQSHYTKHYVGGEFAVIECRGVPIGRLYLFRGPSEIRVTDISLLPEWRGRGIGSTLLAQVQAEAEAAGQRITLHVEKFNPAQTLYHRLGFAPAEDLGIQWRLQWPAPPSTYEQE